jgi:hypothetical protein
MGHRIAHIRSHSHSQSLHVTDEGTEGSTNFETISRAADATGIVLIVLVPGALSLHSHVYASLDTRHCTTLEGE